MPSRHNTTVPQFVNRVGVFLDQQIVRGDQHRDPFYLTHLLQQGKDLPTGGGVQLAGGFVGQDQVRAGDQGAGDG
jgi:hypothetical protein